MSKAVLVAAMLALGACAPKPAEEAPAANAAEVTPAPAPADSAAAAQTDTMARDTTQS